MELLHSIKPILRLPFRSHLTTPTVSSQLLRTFTTSTSAAAPYSPLSTFGKDLSARTVNSTLSARSMNAATDSKHPLERQPWHLHCYATKHNTHLTLTKPNRDAVISISTGQIGFKKAQRGDYDAAYQLGAYLMARMQRAGIMQQIDELEFVLRGFGKGREAITKIITGTEGAALRGKVSSVTDSTRLKFGGTRSPRPRRLG